jgi:death on curing protein
MTGKNYLNDSRNDTLPSSWYPFVSVARVVELHAEAVRRTGESATILNQGLLESAVHGAVNAAMYIADDRSPDVLHVAAYLLCYIARNHAFEQGNKRAAWLACEEQLRVAKLRIDAATADAEKLVLGVVAGEMDPEAVIHWMGQHLIAYEPSANDDGDS